MNTLNKLRIVFCLLMFSGMMVFGQVAASQQETPKLTRAEVEMTIREISEVIISVSPEKDEHGSTMISYEQFKVYEDIYKSYYNLPEIEKLTGYSREWYGAQLKIVTELYKCSFEINNAVVNVRLDKLEELNKKYEELRKDYKQIYNKPQKAK